MEGVGRWAGEREWAPCRACRPPPCQPPAPANPCLHDQAPGGGVGPVVAVLQAEDDELTLLDLGPHHGLHRPGGCLQAMVAPPGGGRDEAGRVDDGQVGAELVLLLGPELALPLQAGVLQLHILLKMSQAGVWEEREMPVGGPALAVPVRARPRFARRPSSQRPPRSAPTSPSPAAPPGSAPPPPRPPSPARTPAARTRGCTSCAA